MLYLATPSKLGEAGARGWLADLLSCALSLSDGMSPLCLVNVSFFWEVSGSPATILGTSDK